MIPSLTIVLAMAALDSANNYIRETQQWREKREAALRAEDGWLTLIGLVWLKEGENRIGSALGSDINLPAGFPEHAGTIVQRGDTVRFIPASPAMLNGKPAGESQLRTDKSGSPDIIGIGGLKLHIIDRENGLGVRIKDPESEARRNFQGLSWYPVNSEWKIRARLVSAPKKIEFEAQAGGKQEMTSPGYVEWEHEGKKLRLTPVTEGDRLWFIFRDKTAGVTTYPAARFLYADAPKDGIVTVDFNRAYNPPCVFTPYATCPLPPPENRLNISVEAGEKMYAGH